MTTNLRKCIGCNTIKNRSEMFRILKTFDTNEIILTPSNKDFGRSVYICKDKDCIEKAFKKGRIERYLKNTNLEALKNNILNLL